LPCQSIDIAECRAAARIS